MAWGSWISAWHTASDFRSGEILWKASIYCEVFWASREKMVSKLMLISIWHASMEHVPYAGQSANVRGCAKVKVAGSWPSQSLWSRQRDVLGNGNSAQGTQVSAWTWGNTEGQRTENSREKRLGTSHPLTTLGDRIAWHGKKPGAVILRLELCQRQGLKHRWLGPAHSSQFSRSGIESEKRH